MLTSRWLMLLMPFVVMESVNAAPPVEHTINASSIGTGGLGRALNWNTESLQSPVWCGTACSYLQVSTAKIAPDAVFTNFPATWPGSYVTSFPEPASVSRSLPTPQGTLDSSQREIVYESTAYERAAKNLTHAGAQSLTAVVYQSGNQGTGQSGTATAALAYHVQVQNQSSGSRDYFVRFTAPNSIGGVNIPYNIGGPSGFEPIYVSQKKYAKSRSAVDVLVNGLPVWSTASNYIIPDVTYSSSDYAGFSLDWGSASDNDSYTVFVGRFASADIFNVDFIVRADALARAPTCGKVTEPATYPNPRVLMHCFLISEGRDLPPSSNLQDRFEIYSKDVSTPLLQILPGPLPVSSSVNLTP